MYGLTECKRCTYLPPSELKNRTGSVGIAIPGTEAFVVDDDGRRAAAGRRRRAGHPRRARHERLLGKPRGDRPGAAPRPARWERVLHTGDLFRTDDEGFLYFVGRKDDIIKSRGEKVAPKEVENVIYAFPGVAEVAVIGVPDPILGSAIKAVVAGEPGAALQAAEIVRHCARFLEDYMVPKVGRISPVAAKDGFRQNQPPPGRRNPKPRGTMTRHSNNPG